MSQNFYSYVSNFLFICLKFPSYMYQTYGSYRSTVRAIRIRKFNLCIFREMETLPTFELLSEPNMGNLRCLPRGDVVPLVEGAPCYPRKGRSMTPCILFDLQQPLYDLNTWTIWSKEATCDTKGRVTSQEFRAKVCFQARRAYQCVSVHS